MLVFGALTGCGEKEPKINPVKPPIEGLEYVPGSYDSEDFAVITAVDTQAGTVSFWNFEVHRQYTLNATGDTVITDKFGSTKQLNALEVGDVVTVRFLEKRKILTSITYSTDVWEDLEVRNFSFDAANLSMTVGSEKYNFPEDLPIFYGDTRLTLADVAECDILNVAGRDHTVYSISVQKSHGYVRLQNDTYFVGGWLEISKPYRITENMEIAVPEGTYTATVSNEGNEGSMEVTIEPGKLITLDLGAVEIEKVKFCHVTFSILPKDTQVTIYVDGKSIAASEADLEYGNHSIVLTAADYKTVSLGLKAGSPSYEFTYTLEAKKDTTVSPSASPSATPSVTPSASPTLFPLPSIEPSEEPQVVYLESPAPSTAPDASTTSPEDSKVSSNPTTAYVFITEPSDTEIYLDGAYIGISPLVFKKESGSHDITLRRSGCQTRTYTIQLDATNEDAQYTFKDLLPIE